MIYVSSKDENLAVNTKTGEVIDISEQYKQSGALKVGDEKVCGNPISVLLYFVCFNKVLSSLNEDDFNKAIDYIEDYNQNIKLEVYGNVRDDIKFAKVIYLNALKSFKDLSIFPADLRKLDDLLFQDYIATINKKDFNEKKEKYIKDFAETWSLNDDCIEVLF